MSTSPAASGFDFVGVARVHSRCLVDAHVFGFLGAAVLFLLDYRRSLLYIVGIVYTAVQFPLWYVANAGEFTTLGYVDKILQGALIVVLTYLYWRARKTNKMDREATAA